MIGEHMEPFLRLGTVEPNLQVELRLFEEEFGRKRIHALPAEEDNIVTTVDGNTDRGIGFGTIAPVNRTLGIPEFENELSGAVEVSTI